MTVARFVLVPMGAALLRLLSALGRRGEAILDHAASLATLTVKIFVHAARGRIPLHDLAVQCYTMGVQSLPIIVMTAALSGLVTTQQGGYQFTGSIPLYILGSVVVNSMVLELGPVVSAFVFIGRVGARITAELGTMKVSEQIDAFHALGRDPIGVLGAPRVLAGVMVFPVLVAIANIVGIYSGMIAAEVSVGLGSEAFWYGARLFWHRWNLVYSLGKGLAFGLAIPLIAVHMGLRTSGGAQGVGRSTTQSVVFMTVTLLVLDALFPPLFLD